MSTILIAKEFSRFPAGRYHPKDGDFSGERFRSEFLIPKLNNSNEIITVILDGVKGYPSSFLEEAFGGLLRLGFSSAELKRRLRLKAEDPAFTHYVDEANQYMDLIVELD